MSEQELLSGLTARAAEGNQEATLMLGLLYMRDDRVPEDPERAESYLKLVLEDPRAQHNLGLLYLSAKLGEEKMQDGIDLLLASARGGDGQSYIELAKAFYDTAGITPNYSYVWIFANMALEFAEFKDQQQRETIESWIKESGSQRAQAISERLLEIERREVRWSLALM
jgi:TPR repeat protein